MRADDAGQLILRGRKIRVDDDGFVCLNDIHRAAGFSTNNRPVDWQRLSTTHALIVATHERIVGKSHQSKFRTSDVYRAKSGANGGTWAHPILAAAYAGYLKPELEVEMREVWLRYKAADPTLADDVLSRATDEQNEWAAVRALGRVKRNDFTKALDKHGVEGFGFGNCTNAVYGALFDATAKKLREVRALPASANLRNAMTKDELVFVMAAETLARQRIEEENPHGNGPCTDATKRSAMRIRNAIDEDTKDRQKRLG
ncbi:MAG: KilA-N domain-containing protein [Paracoccaceae bacterium]